MTICDKCGKTVLGDISIEITVRTRKKNYNFSFCPPHGHEFLTPMEDAQNALKQELGWYDEKSEKAPD